MNKKGRQMRENVIIQSPVITEVRAEQFRNVLSVDNQQLPR